MGLVQAPDRGRRWGMRYWCGTLLCLVWGMLVLALFELPDQWPGLLPQARAQLARSGVEHPVTAVLLNFRGYDTLLEVLVLFLAVLGVWSLGFIEPGPGRSPAGPLLAALVRLLLPILVLASTYLLVRGTYGPGGAFQAGALLGTAGVLLLLSDVPISRAWFALPLKVALMAGPAVFLAVAAFPSLRGGALLQYPVDWAGPLILLVEVAATLSIAAALFVLFAGGRPQEVPPALPPADAGDDNGEEV